MLTILVLTASRGKFSFQNDEERRYVEVEAYGEKVRPEKRTPQIMRKEQKRTFCCCCLDFLFRC